MAKRKRRASPAQLAARKAFAAKYGGKKRKARKARKAHASRPKHVSRRKRRALSAGKHRPVVIRKRGRLYRPRRSSLPSHAKFANPLLGGLAMIGNPRKRRKARRSHRRSHSRVMTLRNPMPAVLAAPREMVSKQFITEAASVAVGFVLPNVILPRLPLAMRDATWKAYASKIVIVAALSGGTSLVNKRVSKAILLGGGVSILLDVWTDFVAPAVMGHASSAPTQGTSAYYGDPGAPGVGAFYGGPGDPGVGDGIGDAFGGDGESWG